MGMDFLDVPKKNCYGSFSVEDVLLGVFMRYDEIMGEEVRRLLLLFMTSRYRVDDER